MSDEKTLTVKQMAAIRSLLVNPSMSAAAGAADVAERTISRWLSEQPFRDALATAQGDALDAAARSMVGLTESAITVLQSVLDAPEEKTSNRLRAASIVLDNVLRLVELRDLARRVAALEDGDNED